MPEILEAEQARLLVEERALGREIASVDAPDSWYLKRGLTPRGDRVRLIGDRVGAGRRLVNP